MAISVLRTSAKLSKRQRDKNPAATLRLRHKFRVFDAATFVDDLPHDRFLFWIVIHKLPVVGGKGWGDEESNGNKCGYHGLVYFFDAKKRPVLEAIRLNTCK